MAVIRSPVQEVAFTVQRQVSNPLSAIDVTNLRQRYIDRFPLFQQHAANTPISIQAQPPQLFQLEGVPQLKYWFMAPDAKLLLQIQHDRFGLNWRRLAPADQPAEYPGFEYLHNRFQDELRICDNWLNEQHNNSSSNVLELFYHNAIPLSEDSRISDLLAPYTAVKRLPIVHWQLSWTSHFVFSDQAGLASTQCSTAFSPDGQPLLVVNLTVRCEVDEVTPPRLTFEAMHDHISASLPEIFTPAVLERFS